MRPKTQRFETSESAISISLQTPGLTLIEVMVFFSIISIAILGALSIYSRHVMGGNQSEQRRIAMLAAEQKLDEIRSWLAVWDNLDRVYKQFQVPALTAPLTMPDGKSVPFNAKDRCLFTVPNLPPATHSSGVVLPTGCVTVIDDETPDEADFGIVHGTAVKFCVDINGNRTYDDPSVKVPLGLPFPLDLNGNGTTAENAVTANFVLLPLVITIQWQGPYGRDRIDLFTVLAKDEIRK